MDSHLADLARRLSRGGQASSHLSAWAAEYRVEAFDTDAVEGHSEIDALTPLTDAQELELEECIQSRDSVVRADATERKAVAIDAGRHSKSSPTARRLCAERLVAAQTLVDARDLARDPSVRRDGRGDPSPRVVRHDSGAATDSSGHVIPNPHPGNPHPKSPANKPRGRLEA